MAISHQRRVSTARWVSIRVARAALLNRRSGRGSAHAGVPPGRMWRYRAIDVVAERGDDRERRGREQVPGEPEADPRLRPQDRGEREGAGVGVPWGQVPGEIGDVLAGSGPRHPGRSIATERPSGGRGSQSRSRFTQVVQNAQSPSNTRTGRSGVVRAGAATLRCYAACTPLPPGAFHPGRGEIARTTDSALDSCVRRKDPDDSFPPCNDWPSGDLPGVDPRLRVSGISAVPR